MRPTPSRRPTPSSTGCEARGWRLAAGVDGVLVPGEPELARRAERAHGTPIDAASWAQITQAARDVGMTEESIAAVTAG